METWKHEDIDIETWKYGEMEKWRHGEREAWRRGHIVEMWTWRH